MKRVAVLGSTGSIGTQTLSILAHYHQAFQVVALAAGRNTSLLADQVQAFSPQLVCVADENALGDFRDKLAHDSKYPLPFIAVGETGLCDIVTHEDVDIVVVGITGFAGLLPTLRALEAGKKVLTANKETFVVAGHLVAPYLDQIVPLDSEHSAIFQCLQGCQSPQTEVRKLYLTASGGPFRSISPDALASVTPQQALQHPNWQMGPKVTIDSATMMNKGLEIIEAHHLFQMPLNQIEVVVHPQSIIHSAVAFNDGSIIAQLGQPDMRVPLQYGLTFPERWSATDSDLHLDLTQLSQLELYPADPDKFPCLALARQAAKIGGTMPVVLNAADELAVDAFLKGRIGFMDIPRLIEQVMNLHAKDLTSCPSLSTIQDLDQRVRGQFDTRIALNVN